MSGFSLDTSAAIASQPWRRESVRDFFEAVAWDGRPALPSLSLGAPRAESTMTTAVADFFGSIPWDGQPTIGVPIAPLSAAPASLPEPEIDLTLDGFSDLFG